MNTETLHPMPSLLTLTQAAKVLGVSRSTLYKLIDRAAFPVVRPTPDAPRIRTEDLAAYVRSLAA